MRLDIDNIVIESLRFGRGFEVCDGVVVGCWWQAGKAIKFSPTRSQVQPSPLCRSLRRSPQVRQARQVSKVRQEGGRQVNEEKDWQEPRSHPRTKARQVGT